jgi:hypothetical protein
MTTTIFWPHIQHSLSTTTTACLQPLTQHSTMTQHQSSSPPVTNLTRQTKTSTKSDTTSSLSALLLICMAMHSPVLSAEPGAFLSQVENFGSNKIAVATSLLSLLINAMPSYMTLTTTSVTKAFTQLDTPSLTAFGGLPLRLMSSGISRLVTSANFDKQYKSVSHPPSTC